MDIIIKNSRVFKTIIFFFPVVFVTFMLWLRINQYATYEIIGLEDHIIEYSQVFFFLSGGIVAFLIALKFRKIYKLMFFLFLVISLGLIGIAGEEISWGQRIFNIETPEAFDSTTTLPILKYNIQGEMNLHNFKSIHDIIGILYLVAGCLLIFFSLLRKLIEKIFKLSKNIKKYLIFFTLPPILIFYFVPVVIHLLNKWSAYFPPQDYEIVEFLFSLGILIFLLRNYLYLKQEFKT